MAYPKFKHKHLQKALFNPIDIVKYKELHKEFPKKYIFIYQSSALKFIQRKYKPKKLKKTIAHATIYKYKNIGFVKMNGIGCPHVTVVLETLIALGGKIFLNIGIAGGLHHDGIFLCQKALRDEGTSYHYIAHGHFSYPDEKLTRKLGRVMEKQRLKYFNGITWTIDAPYRETRAEVEKYSKKGISTVEMEASAIFAVAKLRKVKIASAFVVSDILGKNWEPKFHKFDVKRALNKLLDAAVECLIK